MPPITALLHTANAGLRRSRFGKLLPCAEILIVDRHSTDSTLRVARQYGARIVADGMEPAANGYLEQARYDWIICLDPRNPLPKAFGNFV